MINFLAYIAGCLISLSAHEAGHLLAALTLGVTVRRVGITWRGPYIVREAGRPSANAAISAAGPAMNLVMAVLVWHSWPMLGLINLVLGTANLLPTPTSDGRRAWRAFVQARSESGIRAGVAPESITAS
jgi:Zn-dependent protease